MNQLTYKIAKCCIPEENDEIIGYFKEEGIITVHNTECKSISSLRIERLLDITWTEIKQNDTSNSKHEISKEIEQLDETDYLILKHHQEMGMDYSKVVAETLYVPLDEIQDRHKKLRELGGLKRVEGRIIHYRKNIVKGKWIKHRNHTYYELTPEGNQWITTLENTSGDSD
ncbi:DUF2250 domain-containing protein [Candidatus Poribacteria bacterium]|nr:DUF2250 domain-containing protein [Candidatus Poribacteria bacterium]